jgi:hypothetical protein
MNISPLKQVQGVIRIIIPYKIVKIPNHVMRQIRQLNRDVISCGLATIYYNMLLKSS